MGVAEYLMGLTNSVSERYKHSKKLPRHMVKIPLLRDVADKQPVFRDVLIPQKSKTLCNSCGKKLDREGAFCLQCWTHKMNPPQAPDPQTDSHLRFVAAESLPGTASGRIRMSMCYGGAENANGLWDNLIRCMEDG